MALGRSVWPDPAPHLNENSSETAALPDHCFAPDEARRVPAQVFGKTFWDLDHRFSAHRGRWQLQGDPMKRPSRIHQLKLRLGRWKWREGRLRALLIERCQDDSRPLRPSDLTRYNKQLEEIKAKQKWVANKLTIAIKAKERAEAMRQLPKESEPDYERKPNVRSEPP
jgi:hypothetical protein